MGFDEATDDAIIHCSFNDLDEKENPQIDADNFAANDGNLLHGLRRAVWGGGPDRRGGLWVGDHNFNHHPADLESANWITGRGAIARWRKVRGGVMDTVEIEAE